MNDYERAGLYLISVLLFIAIVTSLAQLSHGMTMPKGWGKGVNRTHRVVVHKHPQKITRRTWRMPK